MTSFHDTERSADRSSALADCSFALAAAGLDLPTVTEAAVRHVAARLGDTATLRLLSDDGTTIVPGAWIDPDPVAYTRIELELGFAGGFRVGTHLPGKVVASDRPCLVADADAARAEHTLDADTRQFLDVTGIRSYMIVPLRSGGRLHGTLSVGRLDDGATPYTASDLAYLEDLADLVALAVADARSHDHLNRELAETRAAAARNESLAGTSAVLASVALDLPAMLRAIAERVGTPLGEMCIVEVTDANGDGIAALHHPDPDVRETLQRRPELLGTILLDPCEAVRRDARPMTVPIRDLDAMVSLAGDDAAAIRRLDAGGATIVPLRARDEVLGTLTILRRRGARPFDAGDVTHVQELADRAALAIANARLVDDLRSSEYRFRRVFEHSPLGMCVADTSANILRVNPPFTRMAQRNADEIIDHPAIELVHPDDRASVIAAARSIIDDAKPDATCTVRLVRPDGRLVWLEVHLGLLEDATVDRPLLRSLILAQCVDVTERRRAEAELVRRASHDPLTGLPNRGAFLETVDRELNRPDPQPIAVFCCDLDRFSHVNDTLGHAAGDAVLCELARRIGATLRPGDVLARFGGDTFAVLVRDCDSAATAAFLAEQVQDAISAPVASLGGEVFPTAGIGVALAHGDTDAETLLRRADVAVGRAKAIGRGRCEIYDATMAVNLTGRLELENRLRSAIDRRQLSLWYQAQLDLHTGTTVAAEALLRWRHPDRGLISAGQFIGIAEESGLILPIGSWVMHTACAEAASWQNLNGVRPLKVSVNLSARQFAQPDLLSRIVRVLEQTRLRPESLCLEITESVLMEDTHHSVPVLRGLADLGVHLAIDDFGTGYASLAYLKRFPVDTLKIDKSFVDGVASDKADLAICGAIIDLANRLGLTTIAEGAETEAQLDALRELGCDLVQGHVHAAAQPVDDFVPFVLAESGR